MADKETQEFYDRLSANYDIVRFRTKYHKRVDMLERGFVLDGVKDRSLVLEVGAGTGLASGTTSAMWCTPESSKAERRSRTRMADEFVGPGSEDGRSRSFLSGLYIAQALFSYGDRILKAPGSFSL